MMLRAKITAQTSLCTGNVMRAQSELSLIQLLHSVCHKKKPICSRNNAFGFHKKMRRVEFHVYLELLVLVFQLPNGENNN